MGANSDLLRDDKRHEATLLATDKSKRVKLRGEAKVSSVSIDEAGPYAGVLRETTPVWSKRAAFSEFVGHSGRWSKQARRRIRKALDAAETVGAATIAAAEGASKVAGEMVGTAGTVANVLDTAYDAADEGLEPDALAQPVEEAMREHHAMKKAQKKARLKAARAAEHAAATEAPGAVSGADAAAEAVENAPATGYSRHSTSVAARSAARASASTLSPGLADAAVRGDFGSAAAATDSAMAGAAGEEWAAGSVYEGASAVEAEAAAAAAPAARKPAAIARLDARKAREAQAASSRLSAGRTLNPGGATTHGAAEREAKKRVSRYAWRERTRRVRGAQSAIRHATARRAAQVATAQGAKAAGGAAAAAVGGLSAPAGALVALAFAVVVIASVLGATTAMVTGETAEASTGGSGQALASWAIGEYDSGVASGTHHAGGADYNGHKGVWCSDFVIAGWKACGFDESIGTGYDSMANSWICWVKEDPSVGELIECTSSYDPKPGDIIVRGDPIRGLDHSKHVGIVVSEKGEDGKYRCIEGNYSDQVGSTYYIPGADWNWIFRPNYPAPSYEDVDLSLPESQFVKEWGAPIDQYLAAKYASGALAGHGETIAREAQRNGLDPRIVTAISVAETSAGQAVAWGGRNGPHNYWSWGNDPTGRTGIFADTVDGAIAEFCSKFAGRYRGKTPEECADMGYGEKDYIMAHWQPVMDEISAIHESTAAARKAEEEKAKAEAKKRAEERAKEKEEKE